MSTELTDLQAKIRRLQDALQVAAEFPEVEPISTYTDNSYSHKWDFGETDASPERLINLAHQVVASIASLKDYTKSWCKANGSSFNVETWLDSSRPAAIVHDLWNRDKHGSSGQPKYPPRSGVKPAIVDVKLVLRTRRGVKEATLDFDRLTGQMIGMNGFERAITGRIVDETGNSLGEFLTVCRDAVDAWTSALAGAGVPLK